MLKKIHIENFRVFEHLNLDFRDGLNVLVGGQRFRQDDGVGGGPLGAYPLDCVVD